jgi:nucleoside-diphosphate-sugar epimerase
VNDRKTLDDFTYRRRAAAMTTPIFAAGSRPTIALTGATGFVGRFLLKDLKRHGYNVRALLRSPGGLVPEIDNAVIGDIAHATNLVQALRGVDYVVHSAAIAHALSGRPEEDYRAINTEGTKALAQAAAKAGVKRFVFLSSVRAQSGPSAAEVLDESMEPAPTDAYGRSKLAAEQALAEVGIDWAALRPVLVYGPGLKGNLASLFTLARRPIPLPFAGFDAKRSLISLQNLSSAVRAVIETRQAPNRALLAADPQPISLAEMLTAIRSGLGRKPRLFYAPPALIGVALRLTGRSEAAARLNGALVVDTSALREIGWMPQIDSVEGLKALARDYVRSGELF